MKRALVVSLVIHLSVVSLAAAWLWSSWPPVPPKPVFVRFATKAPAALSSEKHEARPLSLPGPNLPRAAAVPGPGAARPAQNTEDPASLQESAEVRPETSPLGLPSGLPTDDLVVEAMTTGPTVEHPALIGYPPPQYPRNARRLGWEGVVETLVTVDKEGRSVEVLVVRSSGHAALDQAALGALRQARFRPGSRNGIPETGSLTVTVRFRLE